MIFSSSGQQNTAPGKPHNRHPLGLVGSTTLSRPSSSRCAFPTCVVQLGCSQQKTNHFSSTLLVFIASTYLPRLVPCARGLAASFLTPPAPLFICIFIMATVLR
jgi:hypothetical protein